MRAKDGGKWASSTSRGGRPSFHSTRVEEKAPRDAGSSQDNNLSDPSNSMKDVEEVLGGSEDDDAITSTARSYNYLLQSLNTNIQRGLPQRKRRKTYHEYHQLRDDEIPSTEPHSVENAVSAVSDHSEASSVDEEDSKSIDDSQQREHR